MGLKAMIAALRPRPRAAPRKLQLAAPVAPVLLLATGAGVAVWWWTQWARGRAESEAPPGADPPQDP